MRYLLFEAMQQRAFVARQAMHPGGIAIGGKTRRHLGKRTAHRASQRTVARGGTAVGVHLRLQVTDKSVERVQIFRQQGLKARLAHLGQRSSVQLAVVNATPDQGVVARYSHVRHEVASSHG
jgi:hypothetical protein